MQQTGHRRRASLLTAAALLVLSAGAGRSRFSSFRFRISTSTLVN